MEYTVSQGAGSGSICPKEKGRYCIFRQTPGKLLQTKRKTKKGDNMPGGDRTGPAGQGPMTGRAAGFCAGYQVPGYMNPWGGRGWGRGFGRGFGRGYGRGMGWGRGWGPGGAYPGYAPGYYPQQAPAYQPPSREDELRMLRDQLKYAEEDMKAMRERIAELGKEKPAK